MDGAARPAWLGPKDQRSEVKKARGMFLKLKPGERQAAMAMLDDD